MSGTSVDAIDSALVSCDDHRIELLATHQHAIPTPTRQLIATLSHSGADEIEREHDLDYPKGETIRNRRHGFLSAFGTPSL